MLSNRHVPLWAIVFIVLISSRATATQASKLLPADTKVVVSINLRQALVDHKKTAIVQNYLEQWRLALQGDEPRLKKYYQVQELYKSEGISEKDFLLRARLIKMAGDLLGIDPLEDVDKITLGFKTGDKAGCFIAVIEGRFKRDKIKDAVQQIGRDFFGSFKMLPGGDVWQIPDNPDGACVSLLDGRTIAITDSDKTMNDLLALAAGKKQAGLAQGMRNLLESVEKEHVGIVLADVDIRLKELLHFLKDDFARTVGANDAIGKFIVGQGADWIQRYVEDLAAVGLGVSFRAGDVRLSLGVDVKKPATAKDLHRLIQISNLGSALALKAVKGELAQQLSSIMLQQRISLKETTLLHQAELPHAFVKLLVQGPWLAILSKDFAPADPKADAGQAATTSLLTRLSNMQLWKLPARDKSKPLPDGTYDVLEIPGIAYRDGPADPVRQRLDMYLPKNKKDFPVVVLVHGGAWVIGDNRCAGLYTSVGQFLASQGIGVVMPNYRLSPGVKHPEHAKDVARAVAWTRANIGKHGGDLSRVYLAGHSAGAHLVSLLATDETYLRTEGLKTADLKGIIPISGVYKLPPGPMHFALGGSGPRAIRLNQHWPLRGDHGSSFPLPIPGFPIQLNILGAVFGDTPDQCMQASPITHVRKGLPPFLILVAESDLPTLSETANEFHQALKSQGCDTRLLRMAKRNHVSLMFSVISPDDPAARAIIEFIRK